MREAEKYIQLYREGKLEPIPGKDLEESLEAYVIHALQRAKNRVTELIVREKWEEFVKNPKNANNFTMIVSGARGSLSNLVFMMGTQGQAFVREKRPHRGFYQRVLAHFKRGDIGPYARGFIRSCLRDGLNMVELFFMGMGGRMGEVDKGVSTQISGYYYRRLSNALMDVIAFPDGTVREVTRDALVQFVYGDDGVFPMKTEHGDVPLETLLSQIRGGKR